MKTAPSLHIFTPQNDLLQISLEAYGWLTAYVTSVMKIQISNWNYQSDCSLNMSLKQGPWLGVPYDHEVLQASKKEDAFSFGIRGNFRNYRAPETLSSLISYLEGCTVIVETIIYQH